MLAPPDDFFGIRPFSAEQAPANQAFPVWTRMLNKWLLGAHGRRLAETPFDVSVRLRVLPDIRFGWGAIGPSLYQRPRDVVADDNDDLMLFMNLGGAFLASHAGRDIELEAGDAYVMACSELGSHTRPQGGKLLCLRARRDAIQPLVRGLDDRLGRVIPGGAESLKLLAAYLRGIGDSEPLSDNGVRALATRHVHDLLALALGAPSDADAGGRQHSVQAARLRASKAIVRRHLADPGLSAELVASRLDISARSLQRLFEAEGTTFSSFVTGERLAKAYSLLADSRAKARSIAAIALECGFGDVSYFNRRFRGRYRASPSDIRHHQHSPTQIG